MLVHFPLVLWLSTPVFDLLCLRFGVAPWWRLSLGVSTLGVAIGVFALMTGLLDYIELSDTGSNDVRLAARHGVRTAAVWCAMSIKVLVAWWSHSGASIVWGSLIVDSLACALLLQGAYFGTKITYGGYGR
jgi:uncharacterized membrane protein